MPFQANSNQPRIAVFASKIGAASTVWMHRQLVGLGDSLGKVICWKHENPELFPLPANVVAEVPPAFQQPLSGWRHSIDSALHRRQGGRRYGDGFSRWLRSVLRQGRIDAVIGQYGHVAMIAERACRPAAIPVFAHFHGYDITSRLNHPRYRQALEEQWHRFAGIIVVADYQRDWFLERGYTTDQVAVIPCGAPAFEIATTVDAVRRSQPAVRDSNRGCEFLFVGRFVDKKDPLAVLSAFERCHAAVPTSRLTMAGFGDLQQSCIAWLATKCTALRQAVHFPGRLSPAEVLQRMAAADVYIQHSRTGSDGDKEGWPVTIAEAMAAGLPVIATRHAGIVDQVIENETGLLCDEGDWPCMADQMIQLASDPIKRQRLATNSATRGLSFEQSIQIQRLQEFVAARVQKNRVLHRRAA